MPFTIPNYDNAEFADQSEPDSVDFNILQTGIAGNGVVSGLTVTAQGTPNMSVAVSAGTVIIGGTVTVVSAGTVSITTSDASNPRFDLIRVNSGGTLSALAGTAYFNPVFPSPSTTDVVLAAVYVPATDTAINSNQIVDKRIFIDATAGGDLTGYYPNPSIGVGKVTSSNILDGTIVDGDISNAANITTTKISGTAVVQSDVDINNTASKIVKRDAGGTIAVTAVSATGTISASALGGTLLSSTTPNSLSGTAAVGTAEIPSRQDHQHGTSGLITTSTTATGTEVSGTFPLLALGTTGVTAGTYTKVTVDTKGRITTATTAALSDLSVPSSDINLNSKKITNLGTPTLSTDAANKAYVDMYITGLDFKPSVRVATVESINLASAPASIDGITLVSTNRVLVKDQATSDPANGIYVFNGAGSAMTRAADVDEPFEITSGLFTFVEEGDVNANSGWTLITDTSPVAVGTTSLQFSQFAASPLLATSVPSSISGTASVGTATFAARGDHQHGTANVALTAGKLSQFGTTSSAELAGVITDETGSGSLVFATGGTLSSPVFVTPNIGAGTGTSLSVSGNLTSTAGTLVATAGTISGSLIVGGSATITSTISASGLAGTLLGTATPLTSLGAGTAGISAIPARQDHVHPASKQETVGTISSTSGTIAYNYDTSTTFYHTSSPTADWVANFTNVPTDSTYAYNFTIVVPQGATAYKIGTAVVGTVQIGGVNTTVKWAGSTAAPVGNNSKTDIWTFTLFRVSGAWTVLGVQSANFG